MTDALEEWMNEVEAICEKATSGPWEWKYNDMFGQYPDGKYEIIKTDSGVYPPEKNDRRFIKNSRTSLPKALKMLRVANEALRNTVNGKIHAECTACTPDACDCAEKSSKACLKELERLAKE